MLYSTDLFFRYEEEINTFIEKQKLKELITTILSQQEMLNGVFRERVVLLSKKIVSETRELTGFSSYTDNSECCHIVNMVHKPFTYFV